MYFLNRFDRRDAVKIKNYRENRKTLSGDLMVLGIQSAIGVNEVNAALGAICATQQQVRVGRFRESYLVLKIRCS